MTDHSAVRGLPSVVGEPVPSLSTATPAVYRMLHEAIQSGLVRSCHDLSEGGLAVAAAEMAIGGRLGLELEVPGEGAVRALFGETTGCLLVEVEPGSAEAFEAQFKKLPIWKLGVVTTGDALKIASSGDVVLEVPVESLLRAWTTPLQ
jgi:phosphoribosylformylglycinamidine synthase